MTTPAGVEDFQGTARYSIQRRLGAGAFGVVYESYDREKDTLVALKVLRQDDPALLYRFKQEFRALADVSHPNLVPLYELHTAGHRWFFTMDLVYGRSFIEALRPPAHGGGPQPAVDSSASTARIPARPAGPLPPPDYARLRGLLSQLVSGVGALHAAGKLHRDIKPSNVLVTAEDRVVLLDFGLVSDLWPGDETESSAIAGTPVYMSPEQASGQPMSAASDWYSVGVMLYEALTGRPPHGGTAAEIFARKRREPVVPPWDLAPATPADLGALCLGLLHPDPEARPSHREILRSLGVPAERTAGEIPAGGISAPVVPFVGREEHIACMRAAFDEARRGKTVTIRIRGPSGMGKSALARRFLDDLSRREPEAVILTGRCHERESVPYKAMDSLIDALSQYLRRLPAAVAAEVLPRDILALTRLFPTLRRVGAVASARRRVLDIPDVQELRRRAFAAMRDLVGRLAERGPLVLFIDDLQWGDADSGQLVSEILRPPDSPALLLIESFRDDLPESPFFLAREAAPPREDGGEPATLTVGELDFESARRLAEALLDAEGPAALEQAATIARESGGNPFFIRELARYRRENGLRSVSELTIDQLILARVAALSEPARRLLEIVAVAGRPLPAHTARDAAGIEGEEQATLAPLRWGHLVRLRDTGAREEIEIFHDRIRASILGHLSREALQSHHRRLAAAIEASDRVDPETLAHHFEEAGDVPRAASWASVAADQASLALAFDRAVNLYRRARALQPDDLARRTLSIKLGDALAKAGRGAEAAHEYLSAVSGANAAEWIEMKRRAAEQLLISGHVEEGLSVIQAVLGRAKIPFAKTPGRALAAVLGRQIWLRLRGLSFRERDATQISAEKLTRIDICWSAAKGLSLVDPLRGYDFQLRHLLLALRAGEPFRISRAFAIQSGHSAAGRGRRRRRATALFTARARALANRIGDPHAEGLAISVAGTAAYLEGRWRACRDLMTEAESILRERCQNVAWELSNTHYYFLLSLYYLGEIADLSQTAPALVEEAKHRGNLFAATNLRTRIAYLLDLIRDDPESAGAGIRDAIREWPSGAFHLQHWYALFGSVQTSLYAGRGLEAWDEVGRAWPQLRRSLLLRLPPVRINSLQLRARAALAAAAGQDSADTEILVSAALADARRIERERTVWGGALAELIRAGAADLRGRGPEAGVLFESAEQGLAAAEMPIFAAAARRRRGVLAGEAGTAVVQSADAIMQGRSIRNPARMTALLAP